MLLKTAEKLNGSQETKIANHFRPIDAFVLIFDFDNVPFQRAVFSDYTQNSCSLFLVVKCFVEVLIQVAEGLN